LNYICPICHDSIKDDLAIYMNHTEGHIIDVIKEQHPEWSEKEGVCDKCVRYYRNQLKGTSS